MPLSWSSSFTPDKCLEVQLEATVKLAKSPLKYCFFRICQSLWFWWSKVRAHCEQFSIKYKTVASLMVLTYVPNKAYYVDLTCLTATFRIRKWRECWCCIYMPEMLRNGQQQWQVTPVDIFKDTLGVTPQKWQFFFFFMWGQIISICQQSRYFLSQTMMFS